VPELSYIITAGVTLVVAALITWFIAAAYHKNVTDKKIGSAEAKAREIIDDALKTAETRKKEMLLEAKEESIKTKNELDKETRERRAEIQKYDAAFFPRKKLLTRSWIPSRNVIMHSIVRKMILIERGRKLMLLVRNAYRNWKESQDLPPFRLKNIF